MVLTRQDRIAAALSYSLTVLSGGIFYLLDPDPFVRFHATQSVIVFTGLFAISLGLGAISSVAYPFGAAGRLIATIFGTLSLLVLPVVAVLWALLMYKAYAGEWYQLPYMARYIARFA